MLCPLSCLCVPCVSVPEPRRSSVLHSLCVVDLSRIVLCSVPPFVCTLFVLSARKVSFAVVKRRSASRGRGSTCWGGQTEAYRHSTSLPRDAAPNNILTSSARSTGDWEGPEALEEVDEAILAARAEDLKSTRTYEPEPERARAPPPPPESESEDDPSSDEYVADGKGDTKRAAAKVRLISS